MSGQRNLKTFYIVLAAVAVVGAGAIWMAQGGDSGTLVLDAPAPVGTLALPGYLMGSDSAPVEVVEYSDFECPFCARFAVLTMPDVQERLINTGLVRWRFLDFPIPGHTKSPVAHHSAACAGEQDKFWEMHDQLYYNQRDWLRTRRVERTFRGYAGAVGLDLGQYDACMKEGRYVARLRATLEEASQLGVNSTPTFRIGRFLVSGAIPYDSLKILIDLAVGTTP